MIVKKKDTDVKEMGVMKIREYKINSDFSGAVIEINGNHGTIKSLKEDRIYFIIKGTGKFIINNTETEEILTSLSISSEITSASFN